MNPCNPRLKIYQRYAGAVGALGNLLAGNVLRDAFTRGGATTHLRPVMAMEEFNLPRRQ